MSTVLQVCVLHTHRDHFDYHAPAVLPVIGARVWVPFRNQKKLGIVIAHAQDSAVTAPLKMIDAVIDSQALLGDDILSLCRWISSYYQAPLSEVLPLALPKKYRLGDACSLPRADYYQLQHPLEEAYKLINGRAHKQKALLALLATQNKPVSQRFLTQQGFTSSHWLPLVHANLITLSHQILLPDYTQQGHDAGQLVLNAEQAEAYATITQDLDHYHCFLLQGVTGSGKTEVYLQVMAQVLARKRQVLILVPEIGLTPQLIARFSARFGMPMAVIHSHLNETERQVAWQLAFEQQVSIIIGTRAAVFTPMPQLGLIIIDEEHDSSLKQMDGVRYSARDTALMRAHKANIPILLGSATPSLESLYNCHQQKYQLLRLTQKALSTTALQIQLVDLRAQPLYQGLSTTVLHAIKEHLQQQNQVLVFINRRGFAPVLLCHQCGWMSDCRACDSHLTWHKNKEQMICHHCGLSQRPPGSCPKCNSTELIPVGSGTQRIHHALSDHFPNIQVLRIDRDETRQKDALKKSLDKIHTGEAQLIVGTQMLAKGHHFPRLSLVVVLDADAGLYNQDFRALEHLGQLLTQVSGRAGRAEHAGQVLIQTHLPQHPLLNLLIQKGYEAFAQELLQQRQQAALPPFQFLAVIRAQSKSLNTLSRFMHAIKAQLSVEQLATLGPAPAPLARKAHQHRMQLLVKSPSRAVLKSALTQMRAWLLVNKLGKDVRWNVDVDPVDLS